MTAGRQLVLKKKFQGRPGKIKMDDGAQEPANTAEPDIDVTRSGRRTGWVAGMPRWVKIFIITTLTLVLLIVVAMLLSGGQHGPGRHLSSAGLDGRSAHVTNTNPLNADATSAPSGR
jgi:hypothetical protein